MADVQAWVNDAGNGGVANYGWLIRGDESQSRTAFEFASREYDQPELGPKLTLTYDLFVPEPGSAGAVLGCLVVLAGRRVRARG